MLGRAPVLPDRLGLPQAVEAMAERLQLGLDLQLLGEEPAAGLLDLLLGQSGGAAVLLLVDLIGLLSLSIRAVPIRSAPPCA